MRVKSIICSWYTISEAVQNKWCWDSTVNWIFTRGNEVPHGIRKLSPLVTLIPYYLAALDHSYTTLSGYSRISLRIRKQQASSSSIVWLPLGEMFLKFPNRGEFYMYESNVLIFCICMCVFHNKKCKPVILITGSYSLELKTFCTSDIQSLLWLLHLWSTAVRQLT